MLMCFCHICTPLMISVYPFCCCQSDCKAIPFYIGLFQKLAVPPPPQPTPPQPTSRRHIFSLNFGNSQGWFFFLIQIVKKNGISHVFFTIVTNKVFVIPNERFDKFWNSHVLLKEYLFYFWNSPLFFNVITVKLSK